MEVSEKNGVKYISIPAFEAAGGVRAAFSTRVGGVTPGEVGSLNLGFARNDTRENVQENYRRFLGAIGLPAENIVLTRQIHTDVILERAEDHTGLGFDDFPDIEADAEITDRPGPVLVKLTADCVPVLLYAPDVRAIAAIHAGWRGTVMRIAEKTAKKLAEVYGADPALMLAAIGPSIGSCCFEVDEPVAKEFTGEFGESCSVPVGAKYHVDLWMCNESQLMDAGLSRANISVARMCTKCDGELFHSYRRDGDDCGSLAAAIALV